MCQKVVTIVDSPVLLRRTVNVMLATFVRPVGRIFVNIIPDGSMLKILRFGTTFLTIILVMFLSEGRMLKILRVCTTCLTSDISVRKSYVTARGNKLLN
jgi:hypothetical protein